MTKYIAWITASLVSLIALGSFSIYYPILQNIVIMNGFSGWQSYTWPLICYIVLIAYMLTRISRILW